MCLLQCTSPDSRKINKLSMKFCCSSYQSIKPNAIYSVCSSVCIDQSLSFVTIFTAVVINLAVHQVSGVQDLVSDCTHSLLYVWFQF